MHYPHHVCSMCNSFYILAVQLYKLSTYNFIDENPHNLTRRRPKMVTLRFISYLWKISHPKQLFQKKGEREREGELTERGKAYGRMRWRFVEVKFFSGDDIAKWFTQPLFPYSIKLLVKISLGHRKSSCSVVL